MSGWVCLGVASILAALANLLLRRGMRSLGTGSGTIAAVRHGLHSGWALGGLSSYVLAMGAWLLVLRVKPLVVAYPLFVSATFALALGASSVVLGEKTTLRHVLGALMIAGGIILAV